MVIVPEIRRGIILISKCWNCIKSTQNSLLHEPVLPQNCIAGSMSYAQLCVVKRTGSKYIFQKYFFVRSEF
jgi:hypothetical protein